MLKNVTMICLIVVINDICGLVQDTQHSGCTVAALLTSFMSVLGNFREALFGHSAFEVHHLICRHYIIERCCDICDVTALHVCWPHDHLL